MNESFTRQVGSKMENHMNESFAEHDKVLRDHGFSRRPTKGRSPFLKMYHHPKLGSVLMHHDKDKVITHFSGDKHTTGRSLKIHLDAAKDPQWSKPAYTKEAKDTSPYTAFSRAKAAMYAKPRLRTQFRYNIGTGDKSGFAVIDGKDGSTVRKHADFDRALAHASKLNGSGNLKEDAASDTVALHKTLKTQGFRHSGNLVRNSVIVGSKFTHPRLGDIHVKDGHAHFRGEKHHDPATLKAHIQDKIHQAIGRESDRKERDHYRNEEVMQEEFKNGKAQRTIRPDLKKKIASYKEDAMVEPRQSFRTFILDEAAGPHPADEGGMFHRVLKYHGFQLLSTVAGVHRYSHKLHGHVTVKSGPGDFPVAHRGRPGTTSGPRYISHVNLMNTLNHERATALKPLGSSKQ